MLKVHLEPAQATVTPGTGLIVTVVITNDTEVERSCRVRVVGLEAPWVEHSEGELTVPGGSRLEVPVRITLPLGYPRGETLVGFEVQPDGDERPTVVDTSLSVSDLESLNIGLSPVTVRGGWRGRFRLNIENRGKDPLTIKLSGRGVGPEGSKSDLDFSFKPETVILRPGERVKTRGSVSGKRHVFGNPRRRALTVTAQGETAPRHVQGAFVQRPLMPRNILRIVGLVLVLAMWAGGLTAGVRLTSGKGKADSAQDASATLDPAAGGASGSDGSAGANGTGTEEAAAPAAGGAIAGKVTGPTDASGITVKLRPVALADDLSTDLAAETVSFVASSTDDAPKESAQTLRREPSGPVGPTASTTTDVDGSWAFGGLKTPANYEVTFSKAGFAERTYVVSVDDQAPTVALDVPMVPGNGSLSGTVKGPDGPLGGAVVTVTDGTVTFRATTPDSGDDAGKWSIDGLTTPASYTVTASHRGYGTESTSLALDNGGSKDGVDLTMVPGVGSISGHITGAGVKLGNITVTATNGDVTRTASTLTEGDPGAFSLPQLPIPGDYTISVTGAGWIPQTMALALKGNASKVDLDLVRTTATIVGIVRDSTGKALSSTGVTLAADKPIVKTLSAIDPAGTFELSGLAPGTYTLTFDRADFKSESTIVTVASGDRKAVDMTLTAQTGDKVPKDAVVRGIVRSSTTGAPIPNVSVSTGAVATDLTAASSTATATTSATVTTDATGGFVLDKLAPGAYDLKFSSGKYQPLTRTVRIGAKSDTTIDVTMLILGGVQGVITDLTATPISGVSVTVTNDPTATGQAAFTASTTTDSSGQYSLLEQLPTGKYVATFSRAGYQTRSRNFEAAAGTVSVGDSQLIELGRIHGTIQTADSGISGGFSPMNDVHVLVEVLNGSTWSTVQDLPDVDGEYMITDLAPGDYRVTADKTGFGSSTKLISDLQLREERDGGLVLTPGAQTVAGRASFQDGAVLSPVVGASVSVTAVVGFDTLTVFPFIRPRTATLSTVTNSNGDWTLTGQLAGTSSAYTITKTGFTTQTLSLSPPITAGGADVTLVPNPRNLSGTLSLIGSSDVAGDLPGVNINISGGTTNATVHPDTSGNFSFSDIPVRSAYTLTVSRTGYHDTVTVIAVPSGDHAITVALSALTLTKVSSFTPRVKTGAGANLAGVDITVGSGTAVQTDSNGQHAYTVQHPGSYTLTFHKAGYYDVVRTFTLAAGFDATDVNTPQLAVTLLRVPAISVAVNSLLGSTRTALPSADVTARLLDGSGNPIGATATSTVTTNTYKLSGLSVGTYRVTITAAGHDAKVLPDITVAADDDNVANVTTPIDLLAWSPLKLHLQSKFGTTTDLDGVASNVHAVRTNLPGGAAVPDPSAEPTINFTGSGGGTGVYTSTADVQPGTYLITANPTSHVAGTVPATVVAGTASSQVSLTINQKPRITITTRSHLGASTVGITAVTVTATRPGGTATVTQTGSTNVFVADGLTPATYTVTISAADHDTQVLTVPILDGDDYTNTVTLEKWSPLKLHLQSKFGATTDLDGVASNVHAVRTNLPNGDPVPDPSAEPTINFSGSGSGLYASTASVQPGEYLITANPTSHVAGTVQATVVAGTASSQVDLTINQKPRITITAQSHLDTSTTNLTTATVTVTGPGGPVTVNRTTNVYVADGLTPGAYTVTISATDHDSQTIGPLTIADGDNYTNSVTLQKWAPVSIRVQGLLGTTTSDLTAIAANVNAVGVTPGATSTPTLAFSGGTNGVYTSTTAAPPGTYTITANPTNYVSDTVTGLAVAAGTTTSQQSLVLKHLPQITITTRTKLGSTTSPLNAATVTITGPGGTATLSHTAGTNVHTATNLAVGTYDITVTADDGLHDPLTFLGVSLAGAQSYTDTADVLEWTAFSVRLRGQFNSTLTDLTSNASDLSAVRVLDAQGNGGLTGQPTIAFSGGTNGVYTSTTKVRPGTYTVTATPASYDPNTVDVTAVAGTTPTQGLLVVQKLPALTITVNDILDSTSTPLSGATVTVRKLLSNGNCCAGGSSDIVVATDSNGDAQFTNLSSGRYRVIVTEANHVTQTFTGNSGATQGVVVASGSASALTVDLVQNPPLTLNLSGRTGAPAAFDPTFALAGATATMTATSGGQTTTLTDLTGGTYKAAHVVPGTYTLTVTAPGYGALTPQTGIVIAAGVTHANLTGTLTATPGSITGTVRDSATNAVLSGVTVTASFGGVTHSAATNGSGVYTISGVEPATWSVDYTLTNYALLNKSVTVSAGVAATSNAVIVQFGEHISGTTYGYATDPGVVASSTANPQVTLAGVLVTISRSGYTATATSDVNGAYDFADVPATSGANDYTIAFTHTNYVTRSRSINTTVAGSSTFTDSLIAHTGTATVTVKDLESGATPGLVASASIRLTGVRLPSPLTSTSAADGTVAFANVPPGSYTVALVTPPAGYLASATTVPLTMGASPGIVATTLQGSGTAAVDYAISKAVSLDVALSGLVNGDTATVDVTWSGGSSRKTNQSNGTLSFTDLPPEQAFTVQATATHYTGGAGSSVALHLGANGNATAALVPDPASLEVTVTGLLTGEQTDVTVGGVTKTFLAADGAKVFTGLTPGVTATVSYSNTAGYSGTLSSVTLNAGEDRTGYTAALTPRDGSLRVTVSGLLTGDESGVDVTATWSGGSASGTTNGSGVADITGVKPGVALTVSLTPPTHYTTGSDVAVGALTAGQLLKAVSASVTADLGSIDVTAAGPGLTATSTVTATVTWNGGAGSATANRLDAGLITVPNLPAGVPLTITLTTAGLTADGPKSTTLTAGQLNKSVGTVTFS